MSDDDEQRAESIRRAQHIHDTGWEPPERRPFMVALRPTPELYEAPINGVHVSVRVWHGNTSGGVPIEAYVLSVTPDADEDIERLRAELPQFMHPSRSMYRIDYGRDDRNAPATPDELREAMGILKEAQARQTETGDFLQEVRRAITLANFERDTALDALRELHDAADAALAKIIALEGVDGTFRPSQWEHWPAMTRAAETLRHRERLMPVPDAETVLGYLYALLAEAQRRGAMFPQTKDDQDADAAALHRVAGMVDWYGQRMEPSDGAVRSTIARRELVRRGKG